MATTPVIHCDNVTRLLYGMDDRGALHLLIPVESAPTVPIAPDLRGIRVRIQRTSLGPVLDVIAEPAYERVFGAVCGEMVAAIVDQKRNPIHAVASTLRAWSTAWKPATGLMSDIAQVGLFGELLTLEKIVFPAIGAKAVAHWSGPDRERHDFVGDRLHLEIKTTRKSVHEHVISRLDQLRVPESRKLIVVSVLLEESAAGSLSVATQMDKVVELLRGDPATLDDFLTKAALYGWTDALRHSPDLLRFHLRTSGFFPVDESFPRLPDDFQPPSGVTAVTYTINLANLAAIDLGEIRAAITAGF